MTDANAVTTFEEGAAFRNHPLIASAHAAGENRNTFEAFVRGFIGDLAPVGTIEATLAARAAGIAWRLNRAQSLETQILSRPNDYSNHKSMLADAWCNVRAREAVEMVARWEQGLERSLFKTLDVLERMQRLRNQRGRGGNKGEKIKEHSNAVLFQNEGVRNDIKFEGENGVIRD